MYITQNEGFSFIIDILYKDWIEFVKYNAIPGLQIRDVVVKFLQLFFARCSDKVDFEFVSYYLQCLHSPVPALEQMRHSKPSAIIQY